MIAQVLGEWAAGVSRSTDAVPPESRHAARRLLLDQMGIACAGRLHAGTHPTIAPALGQTGAPQGTLWFDGRTVLAPYAGLVNRSVGDGLELAAGPECVAASVAAAEVADATVGDVLRAIAIASEVEEYLRGWLMTALERHGLHPPVVLGTMAAAVAAAWLLEPTPDVITAALTTAAALTPTSPYRAFSRGSSGKTLYGGWSQMLGVWSALWARAGVAGPASVLEGSRGIAQAWLDAGGAVTPPPFDPDGRAVTRVTFKPYPCNRACHAALTALAQIGPVDVDDVEEIAIWTYPYAVALDARSTGDAPIAAQLSIRTTTALALTFGGLEPDSYAAARLADPRVVGLAARTTVHVDPGLVSDGPRVRRARVRLSLTGGHVREAEAEPLWGPTRPATDDDLRDRFRRFTAGHVSTVDRVTTSTPASVDPWRLAEGTRVRTWLEEAHRG